MSDASRYAANNVWSTISCDRSSRGCMTRAASCAHITAVLVQYEKQVWPESLPFSGAVPRYYYSHDSIDTYASGVRAVLSKDLRSLCLVHFIQKSYCHNLNGLVII